MRRCDKEMGVSYAKEYLVEKRREQEEQEDQIEKEVQEYYRANKSKKTDKKVDKSNIYSLFASDSDDEVIQEISKPNQVKKDPKPKIKMCWADECA